MKLFNRRGDLVREPKFQVVPGAIASFKINIGDPDIFRSTAGGCRRLCAEMVGFNLQPDPPGKYTATLGFNSQLTGHTSILLSDPDTLPAAVHRENQEDQQEGGSEFHELRGEDQCNASRISSLSCLELRYSSS